MSAQQSAFVSRTRQQMPFRNTHVLKDRDTLRLPGRATEVTACQGYAWVSYAGEDIILAPGESMAVDSRADRAVVTSVESTHAVLVLEVVEK